MFAKAAAHRSFLLAFFLVLAATVAFANSPATAEPCESLAHLSLPNARITSAADVAAGAFTPPALVRPEGVAAPSGSPFVHLPAFCRVTATLTPSSDSDIKIEVWLPASGWNSKLQSVGNGGWAGVISYTALAHGVAEGYAAASTDTGHSTAGGSFALGHPEKMTDFAYRSVHVMTVAAKAIVAAFYGKPPSHLLLEWMLNRRPSGSHRSAALSHRLQRHHRGRAREQSNHLYSSVSLDCAGDSQRRIQLHPAEQVPHDSQSRPGRL